ncbi:MAG: UDP-N-acetylglucosamine 1-carboxyvinyltransferase [Oscillospiraceae bacterium]|nr:UDP-N-acetylglucosamine 1-carboxyvinyltransferase [Oscillospiraceae bacterium]
MSAFTITGGRPLRGAARVQGAKNSVLPILAATVLSGGPCVIHNCPDLLDVDSSVRILRYLGCGAERESSSSVAVDTAGMSRHDIPDSMMREMRSSVVFLGAILSRAGEAVMSYPGGCDLGPRPIDLHLSSLRQMGADISEAGGFLICKAPRLTGCDIHLSTPSVGATENTMLAAARAHGTTRILNAAREPEIKDLQTFLNAMGGRVSGAGSSTVVIEGVRQLSGAEHTVIPDRIAAATLLTAVASAGGEILLENVWPEDLETVIAVMAEAGCGIRRDGTTLLARRDKALRAVGRVRTMPHPGFPTDAQAPVMAVTCHAEGTTVFSENVFEGRYRHVGELLRMGADIQVEGHVAVVCGVPKLCGAQVRATDLRGGAALVVAALAAEGETELSGLEHIDRGYEKLEDVLSALGADIKRV